MLARQAQGQPSIMFPRSPALPHGPHRTARSILAKPPPERPYPPTHSSALPMTSRYCRTTLLGSGPRKT